MIDKIENFVRDLEANNTIIIIIGDCKEGVLVAF